MTFFQVSTTDISSLVVALRTAWQPSQVQTCVLLIFLGIFEHIAKLVLGQKTCCGCKFSSDLTDCGMQIADTICNVVHSKTLPQP